MRPTSEPKRGSPDPAGPLPTTLREAGARLRAGTTSATELTERCLRRIAARDPALHAFITVTADLAREQAAAADRELRAGRWRGALHGVPVAVKDFFDTAGVRTTAGSADLAHRVPREDAEVVARLRAAGAVLVGKTNMHRLGMGTTSLVSDFGPVANPLSAAHVAGGSSGGSASAVAAGLCFATVDTDAVGSARLPAACCGVTSLKPSYGLLSTAGILADRPADEAIVLLGHVAVTARTAEDVALAFAALAGTDAAGASDVAPAPTARGLARVGVVRNAERDARTGAVLEAVAESLSAGGSRVGEVDVPFDAARFDVGGIARDRAAIPGRLFEGVDVLLLPTLTADVPTVADARRLGEMAVSPGNTFFCNYLGLPAISVPFAARDGGLPVSLQFVGPPGGERQVLSTARRAASPGLAFVATSLVTSA